MRKNSLHRTKRTVERKFADEQHFFGKRRDITGGNKIRERKRKVVVRTFFLQVSRRERKDDALVLLFRRLIAGVAYCGGHAVARFFNRLVGETDDGEVVQAAREVGFHGNQFGTRADRLGGERLRVSLLRRVGRAL